MSIKSCSVCNAPTTQLCKGCKEVPYCSQDCQRTVWKVHKLECRKKMAEHEGKKGLEKMAKGMSTVSTLEDMQNIADAIQRGQLSLTSASASALARYARSQQKKVNKSIRSLEKRIAKMESAPPS